MINRSMLGSLSETQLMNRNSNKLRMIAEASAIVLSKVINDTEDILYKPNDIASLNKNTSDVNEIIVNKLVSKFKG